MAIFLRNSIAFLHATLAVFFIVAVLFLPADVDAQRFKRQEGGEAPPVEEAATEPAPGAEVDAAPTADSAPLNQVPFLRCQSKF